MRAHIGKAMDELQEKFIEETKLVLSSVEKSIESLLKRDKSIAEVLSEADKEIDSMEVKLEEDCLRIIALHQPVAMDLRILSAVLKINNDLERIADLAVNISADVARLSDEFEIPYDYSDMASKSLEMLRLSLTAFIDLDGDQSRKVCVMDDSVDDMKLDAIKKITEAMIKGPNHTADMLMMIAIGSRFERIADLSTNIAEEVVYIVEGKVIRHHQL